MVSADNLNLDVLEVIFDSLSGNDLPSVALVSRSFLAAVIPRLYQKISYRLRQAKGYDTVGLVCMHSCHSLILRFKERDHVSNFVLITLIQSIDKADDSFIA